MYFLYNTVKSIDQFGSPIVLNYKQKTSLKTHLGGILTFCMAVIGLFLVYYFGKEIITKEKPMISFSKIRRNNSEIFLKDFPIFFVLGHPNGAIMKSGLANSLVTFVVSQYLFFYNETIFLQNVTVGRCDPEKHFGKYKDFIATYISNDKYEDYFCPNYDNNTKFKNDYVTMNSSLFRVQVKKCNNKTDNKVCASEAVQKTYLSEFFVKNYYLNYYIDTSLTQNQETLFLDSYTQQNGLLLSKKNFYRFKTTEIKIDEGWFTEEYTSKAVIQLDNIVPDSNLNEVNSDIIYVMSFESPLIGDLYSISYIKIQLIIGNLGGILNVLMVIGKIACSYVSETSFYLQQTKDLVHLYTSNENDKLNKENKEEDEFNKPSMISIIPFKDDKNLNTRQKENNLIVSETEKKDIFKSSKSNNSNNPNSNKNIKNKENYTHISIPKSKIGICDYLSSCCNNSCTNKSNKSNKKFYEALFDYFEKQLDITGIIQTRHELEIIKSIFITNKEENKDIFNFKIQLEDILTKFEHNKNKQKEDEEKEKQEIGISDNNNKNKLEEEEKKEFERQTNIKKKLSVMQQKTITNFNID